MSEKFKFEYIMSGNGYTRYPGCIEKPTWVVDNIVDAFNEHFQGRHTFALLYNALMEKDFGPMFSDTKATLYSDSGGLQMVTLGIEDIGAARQDVYANQGLFSDYAMCFDEIPLVVNSKGGMVGVSKNARYYDSSLLVNKAKVTANNLKDQIRAFKEMGTDTKAIAIIQGNCWKSMVEWADILFEELGDDISHIGSMALSGVSIGNGLREEIERSWAFKCISQKYNMKHVHLLGVGTYTRLSPFVLFDRLLDDDILISYDSTSHTKSLHFGSWQLPTRRYTVPKHWDAPLWNMISTDVYRFLGDKYKATPQEMHGNFYSGITNLDSDERIRVAEASYYLFATQAFLLAEYCLEHLTSFEKSLEVSYAPKLWEPLKLLNSQIDDDKQFEEWLATFNSSIPSRRVTKAGGMLDDLFG